MLPEMAGASRPTPYSRKVVTALRQAIALEVGTGRPILCHRLAIAGSDGKPPLIYTLFFKASQSGSFRATCLELPEITVWAASE